MVNPLRIGYLNRADSPGILTASTEQTNLPVTNLQTKDVRQLWRSTASPAYVIADLGQSLAVHCVALMQCNLAAASTYRVRISTTDPTAVANLVHDSGTVVSGINSAYPKLVHIIDVAATGRYVRVDLTQASPLPEAGRLFIGRFWSPSHNMAYDWSLASRDASRRTPSIGQAIFIDEKERQRGFQFQLNGLTVSEAFDELEEINRIAGTKRDILVCRDRDASDLGAATIWGLLEQPIAYRQTSPNLFGAEAEIWERI